MRNINLLLLICLITNFAFLKGQTKEVDFTSKEKKYNDWDIAVFVGTPVIQGADLNTFDDGDLNFGYDFQFVLTKQIGHAFGLALQAQIGETAQSNKTYGIGAETQYNAFSLLSDINLSSLIRRVDNRSAYRWSVHGYGGVGLMSYDVERFDVDSEGNEIGNRTTVYESDDYLNNFFIQGGLGLKYKLSKSFDLELKGMYVYTGDEEFDGSGSPTLGTSNTDITTNYWDIEEGRDDSFWTASLGLHYKIGKHEDHLAWVNPLDELYKKAAANNKPVEVKVCRSGDLDDDGVCDDWDRELDTPAGARVDGAGRAFDADKDGIIDALDACVTLPGKADPDPLKNGCPDKPGEYEPILIDLSDIEFKYNSAEWYPEYNKILDKAITAMNSNPDANFVLEGHTDNRGSASYNLRLSQRRADAIKKYLVSNGISSNRIVAIGKGETDPFIDCGNSCTDDEHRQNRRVLLRSDRQLSGDE